MEPKIVKVNGHELTFHHYKEPLEPIERGKGFGYYGALLSALDQKSLQCHMCGELVENMGTHIWSQHKLSGREYREKFKLASGTALMTEKMRIEAKRKFWMMAKDCPEMLDRFKKNWGRWKHNAGKTGHRIALETLNKRGTCPKQLLAKIHWVKERIGHTPSLDEFVSECGTQRYKHLIYKVYGSWANAIKKIGLQTSTKKQGQHFSRRYTKAEVVELLQLFARENNALPTWSDGDRGLIPSGKVILRIFGGIENARRVAGIERILDFKIEEQRIARRQQAMTEEKPHVLSHPAAKEE